MHINNFVLGFIQLLHYCHSCTHLKFSSAPKQPTETPLLSPGRNQVAGNLTPVPTIACAVSTSTAALNYPRLSCSNVRPVLKFRLTRTPSPTNSKLQRSLSRLPNTSSSTRSAASSAVDALKLGFRLSQFRLPTFPPGGTWCGLVRRALR